MYINESGIRSTRYVDTERERNMRRALNEIYEKHGFTITRRNDRKSQFSGIDLEMEKDGTNWIVDEKAATSKNNAFTNLKTFCFEIAANVNKNGIGWLYQNDMETTHYALIFPDSSDNFKTLNHVEIMFVSKKAILNLLSEAGIYGPKDAQELLDNGRFDSLGRQYCYINDKIKIMTSYQLAEEPTNAIIDRGVLRRIADMTICERREENNGEKKTGTSDKASRCSYIKEAV